jgi:hypothetical protein
MRRVACAVALSLLHLTALRHSDVGFIECGKLRTLILSYEWHKVHTKLHKNPYRCYVIMKFVLTDISDGDLVKLLYVSLIVNTLISFLQISVNVSIKHSKLLQVIRSIFISYSSCRNCSDLS